MVTLLSLFDGIGCAGLAMREVLGDDFEYYASEVEPHLEAFTRSKFPNITHLGDIKRINPVENFSEKLKIDYLISGSPCQGLSNAGRRKGLADDRSALFWEAVRIRDEVKPKYWLFENVVSSKANMAAMTEALGVEPVVINSRYFTYQDRLREYWTNIPVVNPKHDPNYRLNQFQTVRLSRKAFGDTRVTPYFPTLTRNIMTNAWAKQVKLRGINQWSGEYPLDWDEYELAQGLPEGYTDSLPNVKRRLAIANAFTVPVITYILKHSLDTP